MQLNRLRELKENWNGEGAPAPTKEAIEIAERILRMIRDEPGQAVPLEDGGVQIEWHADDIDLEIVITPEGTFELE